MNVRVCREGEFGERIGDQAPQSLPPYGISVRKYVSVSSVDPASFRDHSSLWCSIPRKPAARLPGSAALSYPAEAGGPQSSSGPWALCGLVGPLFSLFPRLPFPWSSVHSSWKEMITHCQALGKRQDGSCWCLRCLGPFHQVHTGFQLEPSCLLRGASSLCSRPSGEPLPEHLAQGPFCAHPPLRLGLPFLCLCIPHA